MCIKGFTNLITLKITIMNKYGILVIESGEYVLRMIGTLEECQEFEMHNHMDYEWMRIIEIDLIPTLEQVADLTNW